MAGSLCGLADIVMKPGHTPKPGRPGAAVALFAALQSATCAALMCGVARGAGRDEDRHAAVVAGDC
ncbi:MAG: hypothetical protein WC000_04920, partial [Dokdonella sp.]